MDEGFRVQLHSAVSCVERVVKVNRGISAG